MAEDFQESEIEQEDHSEEEVSPEEEELTLETVIKYTNYNAQVIWMTLQGHVLASNEAMKDLRNTVKILSVVNVGLFFALGMFLLRG